MKNANTRARVMATIALFSLCLFLLGLATQKVDFGYGVAPDGNVWIARSSTGTLVLRDVENPTSNSLHDLLTGGVTDHGALTGLADDDHTQYFDADDLNTKFDNNASSASVGDEWTSGIAIFPDPAGAVTLGGHVTGTTVHFHRPPRIVTVGPNDGSKRAEYTSIQSAHDAISGQSASNPWVIFVYPGSYSGAVVLSKSYVSIIGHDFRTVRLVHTGSVALTVSASNPGVVANITIDRSDSQGEAAITDSGSTSHFVNVRVQTLFGIGYQRLAAGDVTLRDCYFVDNDNGSNDPAALSSKLSTGVAYWHVQRCYFSATATTHYHVFETDDSGGASYVYFDGGEIDGTVEHSGGNGAFVLNQYAYISLNGFVFGADQTIIDSSSVAGIIAHAFVQFGSWGSPTSGLTTTPLALTGPKFLGGLNVQTGNLDMDGVLTIDNARNGYFSGLNFDTATGSTVTVGTLHCEDLFGSPSISAAQFRLTTATIAQKYGMGFFATTPTLNVWVDENGIEPGYKRVKFFSGGDHATNPWLAFAQDGDVFSQKFQRNSDGFAYLQIDVSSTGGSFRYGPYNGFYARATGDCWVVLNATDTSDCFRIRDSGLVDQWICDADGNTTQTGRISLGGSRYIDDTNIMWTGGGVIYSSLSNTGESQVGKVTPNATNSDTILSTRHATNAYDVSFTNFAGAEKFAVDLNLGNLEMIAGAKITNPDNGEDGDFFTWSLSPLDLNVTCSQNETVYPNYVTFSGNGLLYWPLQVPSRIVGTATVIDRITVYFNAQGGGDDELTSAALWSCDMTTSDGFQEEVADSGSLSGQDYENQILSSDVTLETEKTYYLAITTSYNDGGCLIFGWKIEGHTE